MISLISRLAWAAFVLVACSCGGSGEPTTGEPEPARATSGAATELEGSETPSGSEGSEGSAREGSAAHASSAAEPAPTARISVSVDPYARVTLSITNRGAEGTRLASALVLERETEGAFREAELGSFLVGAELATEGCLELASGAELTATWSCLRADAPDLVRDCTRAPAGRYRFVTTSCDGRARTEGEAFAYGE